jgi:hypothetical protein
VKYSNHMGIHVIDISTEVFHLLQRRALRFVAWSDEKPGPTQKILLEDDVYAEFIDRAIAHHQTLDQVVRDACTKPKCPAVAAYGPVGNTKRAGGAN